jgi:hypothetical protein
MRVAILMNKSNARFRNLGKNLLTSGYRIAKGDFDLRNQTVLPEYDSFAKLLDPKPLILSTDGGINIKSIEGYDLLIWEWGWTKTPAQTVIDIRKHLDIPTLLFPGPLDRFWREVDYSYLDLHLQAVEYTHMAGVMLKDTIPFYKSMFPHLYVFHMPVPMDVDYFRSFGLEPITKDRKKMLLTSPTVFHGISSQLPITTYLAFRTLLSKKDDLKGICFTYYGDEERVEVASVFKSLGIAAKIQIEDFVRPIFRYFEKVNPCYIGLYLPHGLIQGRIALISACLGIPMVVSDDIETHTFLYPSTNAKWYDIYAAVNLCLRLLDDSEFFVKVREEAFERVKYYSVENCQTRLLEGIKIGLELKSDRKYSS